MRILKVLPFRLESKRFPDKALALFEGRPLLSHALSICAAIPLGETVLTSSREDYERVRARVDPGAARYVASSATCRSATERVLELARSVPADLYVSIPVDEALLDPAEVERVLRETDWRSAGALTLYCDFFCLEDALSPLSAKVALGEGGNVLYMSRALIPAAKEAAPRLESLKKHVGVYFYTARFLAELDARAAAKTELDLIEGLEQLRWLELGFPLRAVKIRHVGFGIDVAEQVPALEARRLLTASRQS